MPMQRNFPTFVPLCLLAITVTTNGVTSFQSPPSFFLRDCTRTFASVSLSRINHLPRQQQQQSVRWMTSVQRQPASDGNSENGEFVEANDLEALQKLFSKYCDAEGLMTKEAVQRVPTISDLLKSQELLSEEFNDIWDRAAKFPDTSEKGERIDVDSFVQVYRDIDDLFEDGDSDNDEEEKKSKASNDSGKSPEQRVDDEIEGNTSMSIEEEELRSIFQQLSDNNGLLSKAELAKWQEVDKLITDGLLGDDEFEELWQRATKESDRIGVKGFLEFNTALDELFDFDDDDDSDGVSVADNVDELPDSSPSLRMVQGDDIPSDVLFVSLANEDGLVGMDELKRWAELQDMITEGELLASELNEIYQRAKKSEKDPNKLEEDGFVELYNAISELFEVDDEIDDKTEEALSQSQSNYKMELLNAISELEGGDDALACGLDASDSEQKEILSIVQDLERDPGNLVLSRQGAITFSDLAGTWELLYSSSSAMKFNKGLSGLGGSFPNGRFTSLVQKLSASKFLTDVEYVERIEVNPSSASFDVKVTGSWDLRTSVSLFTGEPSIVMTIEPDRVTYGPTSTRADHWKSLGPMNMLDITYLDENLRIMRGNTSVETIFVFRRIS